MLLPRASQMEKPADVRVPFREALVDEQQRQEQGNRARQHDERPADHRAGFRYRFRMYSVPIAASPQPSTTTARAGSSGRRSRLAMSQAPALTAIAIATRGSASGRNHARPPVINASTRRNATTAAAIAAASARGRRARPMAEVAQIHRSAMADSGYRDQVTSNPEARSMAMRIPAAVKARSEMTSQSHLLTLDSDTSVRCPPRHRRATGQSLAKRRSAQRAPLDAFFDLYRTLAAGSHRLPDPRYSRLRSGPARSGHCSIRLIGIQRHAPAFSRRSPWRRMLRARPEAVILT